MRMKLWCIVFTACLGCSAPTSKPGQPSSFSLQSKTWYISYGFKSYEEVIQPSSVPTLILALQDRSYEVQALAIDALGEIGPTAVEAMPHLINKLGSDDARVFTAVESAIPKIIPEPKNRVPYYVEGLTHYMKWTRIRSAEALGKLGNEAVPPLIEALKSDDYLLRTRAADSLGEIGPEAFEAVPELLQVLQSDNLMAGSAAAEALAKIGSPSVPGLIKVLNEWTQDADSDIRFRVLKALGTIGPQAVEAAPAIVRAMGDKILPVSDMATVSLERVVPGDQSRANFCLQGLNDANLRVRRAALDCMAKAGYHAEEAVAALIRTLGESDYEMRKRALQGLLALNPSADLVAPAGLLLLQDPEADMRKGAISLLQKSGYAGPDYLSALERIAESDPDSTVKKSAYEALAKVKFSQVAGQKQVETKTPPPQPSQSEPRAKRSPSLKIGERWAVVIGISRYQDTRIPSLRYAAADAKSFYEWLVSPTGGRYAPGRIKLLLDGEATARNIREALFNWLRQAIEEDVVTIYFAGHGSPDSPDSPENLFFLPYDAQYGRIASTGFPMWDVETALKRFIKAKKTIILADACHAGGVGESFDLATRAGHGALTNPISSGFQDLSKVSDGVCVISASDKDQLSHEGHQWGGGHGVFTYFLLEGLSGRADYNGDAEISLGELIPYLSEQIRRETRNTQSPIVSGRFDPSLSIGK